MPRDMYVSMDNGALYSFSFQTMSLNYISLHPRPTSGLAIGPDGLYGRAGFDFYIFSSDLKSATLIGTWGTDLNALDYSQGWFYAASDGGFYKFDQLGGNRFYTGGDFPQQRVSWPGSAGDITDYRGEMILAADGARLFKIDRDTGFSTLIGTHGVDAMYGLEAGEFGLIGFAGRAVYTISPTTARAEKIAEFAPPLPQFFDAAGLTPSITEQADVIIGSPDGDMINGRGGNDLIRGFGGDDSINGGDGYDTVVFRGPRDEYQVVTEQSRTTVTDSNLRRDGADVITNTEKIVFGDGTLFFDTALPGQGPSVSGSAYRVYQAAFNRTPDLPGLGYWIKLMNDGMSSFQMAQNFVASQEFARVYGANPTAEVLVTGFYNNILGRAPEQSGYNYWFNILNGRPDQRALVLDYISNSPENQARLANVLGQGVFLPSDVLA